MQFVLNIYALHKLVKFNGLLNITIVFKIKIEMAIRSGDVKMNISKCLIDYENKKQEKIYKINNINKGGPFSELPKYFMVSFEKFFNQILIVY